MYTPAHNVNTICPQHHANGGGIKTSWVLKFYVGQPSSKHAQAGAGLTSVREGILISNGSREIRVHMVLCPVNMDNGTRKLRFLISVR